MLFLSFFFRAREKGKHLNISNCAVKESSEEVTGGIMS